jgi:hypothetical protein
MKQYTLLYILDENKVVHMKTFISMKELKDYSYYVLYVTRELTPVDKDGYVWFIELEDELDDILYEATSDGIYDDLREHNNALLEKIDKEIDKELAKLHATKK